MSRFDEARPLPALDGADEDLGNADPDYRRAGFYLRTTQQLAYRLRVRGDCGATLDIPFMGPLNPWGGYPSTTHALSFKSRLILTAKAVESMNDPHRVFGRALWSAAAFWELHLLWRDFDRAFDYEDERRITSCLSCAMHAKDRSIARLALWMGDSLGGLRDLDHLEQRAVAGQWLMDPAEAAQRDAAWKQLNEYALTVPEVKAAIFDGSGYIFQFFPRMEPEAERIQKLESLAAEALAAGCSPAKVHYVVAPYSSEHAAAFLLCRPTGHWLVGERPYDQLFT